MKIMFYINAIHHGGAERVIVNLATQFSKENESVLVTSFKADWEYSYGENVKRISLFEKPIVGTIKRNVRLIGALKKVLKQEKPDVLISFMAEPNIRSVLATRGLKTKLILSVRNDPNEEYKKTLMRVLAKILFKKADGIVFQTKDAQEWFSTKIQKKSRIINNQVDPVFFQTERVEERQNVVSMGRLVEQKNHRLLIEAFSKIADKTDENLIIYGDGPLKADLEKLAEEKGLRNRVFLLGATKEVAKELSKAKVFVLSSDFEGMPNALLEAMAVGVPCVSTNCPCGGPRTFIVNGENGFLVPVNNANALAQSLECILCSTNTYQEQIGNAAKNTAGQFHPDVVFGEWKSFVERIK